MQRVEMTRSKTRQAIISWPVLFLWLWVWLLFINLASCILQKSRCYLGYEMNRIKDICRVLKYRLVFTFSPKAIPGCRKQKPSWCFSINDHSLHFHPWLALFGSCSVNQIQTLPMSGGIIGNLVNIKRLRQEPFLISQGLFKYSNLMYKLRRWSGFLLLELYYIMFQLISQ